ncbi:hypothetical protein K0M31_003616 [Melipona bicolor]|uniref:F-box domain-containing protein n=1 Tax=Melipona bicolor TaxID=60889 RepID=A0AA40G078_9HYME|nr:hypothetical protein K0M31_003616 [Melipona bicolor]
MEELPKAGGSKVLDSVKIDFISELPVEISQLILRKLDPTSLFYAVRVSSKWKKVLKSDKILVETVNDHNYLNGCYLYKRIYGHIKWTRAITS